MLASRSLFVLFFTATAFSASVGNGQSPNGPLVSEPGSRPAVISRGGSRVGFPLLNPVKSGTSPTESRSTYQVTEPDQQMASDLPMALSESSADGLPLESSPDSSRSKMTGPLVTVCSSLAIVLALFSGLVWAGRKFGGASAASKPLPASALTPLGHVMLDPRTKLMLVKCGRRILVLSQTASGITPITEVTHPDEVRELVASCSAEAREVFQKTLREIELEPASGFTAADEDRPTPRQPSRKGSRLFATA